MAETLTKLPISPNSSTGEVSDLKASLDANAVNASTPEIQQQAPIDQGVIELDAVDSPVAVEVPQIETQSAEAKVQALTKVQEDMAKEAVEQSEMDAVLGEQRVRDRTDTEGVAEGFIAETQSLIDKQIDPQTRRDIEALNIMIAQDQGEVQKLHDAIREGRGIQSSIARGQVARERALLGINIATNTAIKTAKEGSLEDAKEMAILGMQVKQQAQQNALENERVFLNRAYKQVDSARQKQADIRLKEIEKAEADLVAIQEIYGNAVLNGASKGTLKNISNAGSLNEARKLAGNLAMSPQEKASLFSANLTNRGKLFELASAGDPMAIEQIGYDPREFSAEKQEEIERIEKSSKKATEHLKKLDRLKKNEAGLRGAVGATPFERSPIGSAGMDGLTKGKFSTEIRFSDKADFLGDVEYILANLTIDALGQLEIPLTPVSDADMNKVGATSNVLEGLAIRDEKTGKVVGIRGSEEYVSLLIDEMITKYESVLDTAGMLQGLSTDDMDFLYERERELLLEESNN